MAYTRPTTSASPLASTSALPPRPREIGEGIMDDGTISANHPLVQKYLETISEKFEKAANAEFQKPGRPLPQRPYMNQERYDVHCWAYLAEHTRSRRAGLVALPKNVRSVIGRQDIEDSTADAIFALAALAVLEFPTRPAHWAIWGKENQNVDTMKTVFRVLGEFFSLSPLLRTVTRERERATRRTPYASARVVSA